MWTSSLRLLSQLRNIQLHGDYIAVAVAVTVAVIVVRDTFLFFAHFWLQFIK